MKTLTSHMNSFTTISMCKEDLTMSVTVTTYFTAIQQLSEQLSRIKTETMSYLLAKHP